MSKEDWVSVDERLPESSANVLILRHGEVYHGKRGMPFMAIGSFDTLIKRWYGVDHHGFSSEGPMDARDDVTHWQPLPEPPEDG